MPKTTKTIEEKLAEGRAYRDIDVSLFERRAGENGEMYVKGYATTFNEPYLLFRDGPYSVYEQIDPGAYDDCDMSDVIMQYDHCGRVFARISNGTLTVGPDKVGLGMEARLDGTELGRQVFNEIEGGYTTKMSQGMTVVEDAREIVENNETGEVTITRTILKVGKLYDVSAVSIPANDATSISARSYGEGVIAEAMGEIHKREERERLKKKIRILAEM